MEQQHHDPTSTNLIARACADDQEAWRQLVHIYGVLVHRWCLRAGLQEEDVADVFQETFRTVSRDLTSYSPQKAVGSFRSWLRSIVRSKVADHFRRNQRQPIGEGGTDAQTRMADFVDPLADEADDEVAEDKALLVHRALELIKPEFAETNWKAFRQVAIDGQSITDVAEQLNLNPQAIRQANYRIRRRLRLVLQDLDD